MPEQRITITVVYDDARWHFADAEVAAHDAAKALADIARYHPGARVEIAGLDQHAARARNAASARVPIERLVDASTSKDGPS